MKELSPALISRADRNRAVRNPALLLMKLFGDEIEANIRRKYHRDGATCDYKKFRALYISACIRELKKNKHKYIQTR